MNLRRRGDRIRVGYRMDMPGQGFGGQRSAQPDRPARSPSPIVQADDLASALELAAGCPHLGANGTVEVHEVHEIG